MIKKLILGAFVGGTILFAWSAVSWMLLPWHNKTMESFTNEPAVSEFFIHNTPKAGVYRLPWQFDKSQGGPLVLASVTPRGAKSMGKTMAAGLLVQIIASFLVTFLVYEGSASVPSYWDRVGCVMVFAVAAGLVCHVPYWNWWGFSLEYTAVSMLDLLVGWFLAGLAIARIVEFKATALLS